MVDEIRRLDPASGAAWRDSVERRKKAVHSPFRRRRGDAPPTDDGSTQTEATPDTFGGATGAGRGAFLGSAGGGMPSAGAMAAGMAGLAAWEAGEGADRDPRAGAVPDRRAADALSRAAAQALQGLEDPLRSGGAGTGATALARAMAAGGLLPPPDPSMDPTSGSGAVGTDSRGAPHLVTPAMQEAFDGLVAEVERLRARLAESQGREAYLVSLADGDGVLPVLNRRTLVRVVETHLTRARESGSRVAAALFCLENFDALCRDQGVEAALSVLARIAGHLVTGAGLSRVVGSLGGGYLLVLAPPDGGDGGDEAGDALEIWARGLRRRLVSQPLALVTGDRVPVDLGLAVTTARAPERAGDLCRRLETLLRAG